AREAGRPFGLVFLDAALPDSEVDHWLRTLDQQEGVERPPVVLLMPLDRAKEQERWRHLGIQAGLIKPIIQSDFFKVLHQMTPQPPVRPAKSEIVVPANNSLSLSVLIAEDNPINQKLAAKLIERMGHQAILAADGREAFDAWSSRRFDVVLMDVQ